MNVIERIKRIEEIKARQKKINESIGISFRCFDCKHRKQHPDIEEANKRGAWLPDSCSLNHEIIPSSGSNFMAPVSGFCEDFIR